MNILFLNNYYYLRGGSEKVMFQEQELLLENRHQVNGFSQLCPENQTCKYEKYFPEKADFEALRGLGKVRGAIDVIRNKKAADNLKIVLKEFNPDVVHAHNIYGGLTTSVLDAVNKLDMPSVLTLHDYKLICSSYLMLNKGQVCEDCKGRNYWHCVKNRCHKNSTLASAVYTMESYYNKWFKKWEKVRYYICPSKFIQGKMLESGFSEEKLVYLPNFVDPDQYLVNYEDSEYILYAGRLSHEKGVLTLLKAMAGLDIPLKIVGDGPLREQVQSFIVDNNISSVELLGYKTGNELSSLYQGAAFAVVPSEWCENAPMSILEAYAYGKPVLGADIGGIPEMIDDGSTGILFKSGDAVDLKDKILNMWSISQVLTKMGKAARCKLEKHYSSDTHYEKLIDVYRRAMK